MRVLHTVGAGLALPVGVLVGGLNEHWWAGVLAASGVLLAAAVLAAAVR